MTHVSFQCDKCILLHLCTFQTPTKLAEMSAKATLPRALQMRKGVNKSKKKPQ